MIELILLILLWAHILLQLLVMAATLGLQKRKPENKVTPFVSILVPARNEEDNINDCLQSLLALDYPTGRFEIIVGNDGSDDHTAALVQAFANQYEHISLYTVKGRLGNAKAKANVLAQLVNESKGEIIFVTDADIVVQPGWVKQLLPYLLETHVGIVSGTTLVDGTGWFKKMQGLEWLLANGNLLGLDSLGMKSTAAGNNMAFHKEAYRKTGGYEEMPFSVTEDFQLFNHLRKLGYKTYNVADAGAVNISKAQGRLPALLHQRKRWMMGAQGLPWYWLPVFLTSALYFPAWIVMLFIHVKIAVMIALIKFTLQSLFAVFLHIQFRRRTNPLHLFIFEPYLWVMNVLMMAFYLMPVKMDWKKRKYG